MPVAGGGFEQAYNAQAAVDTHTMLVVSTGVTQACNDKEQIKPMLDKLTALPDDLGTVKDLLSDTGYYSASNVDASEEKKINSFIAVKREAHHLPPQGNCTTMSAR